MEAKDEIDRACEENGGQKRGPGRPPKCGTAASSHIMMSKCEDCDETCRAGVMTLRHIAKKHPHKLQTFVCKLCGDSYVSQKKLFKHVLQHWSPKSVCPLSEECMSKIVFNRNAALYAHLIYNHYETKNPQPDDAKTKRFYNDKNIMKKSFRCNFCSKAFPKRNLLVRHIRIHTDEKPFHCGYCDSNFNQRSTLKTHILSHINCQPYKCPQCVATFNQRGNMRKHLKLSHPLVVPPNYVKCPYCTCVFSKGRYLTIHLSKFHQSLTEDQIMNVTIDDVMKNLLSLHEQSQMSCETSQLYRDELSANRSSCGENSRNDRAPNRCKKNHENSSDLTKNNRRANQKNESACSDDTYNIGDVQNPPNVQIIENLFSDQSVSIECLNKETYTNKCDIIPMQAFTDIIMESSLQNPVQLQFDLNQQNQDMNDDNNAQFDLNSSDLMLNRSGIDSDMSLFCNSSILNANESFGIEGIQLDSNIFGTLMNFNQLNNPGAEQTTDNKKSCDDYNIPIGAADGDFVADFEEPSDAPDRIRDATVEEFPAQIISNSGLTIEETDQIISSMSDQVNNDAIDEDLLQLMSENSISLEADDSAAKIKEQAVGENVKLKSVLKVLKDVLKLSKQTVYKNPPLNNRCEFCSASFARVSDLIRHRRIHTGEKPFVCSTCNKEFSLKSSLKYHEQTHVDVDHRMKHKCQICGKLFSKKSALSLHKSIHLGKKPYKCPLCPVTYRTPGHRDAHMLSHFKNKDPLKSRNRIGILESSTIDILKD